MGGRAMVTRTVRARDTVRGAGGVLLGFFGVQLFVNIGNGAVANSLLPNLIAELDAQNKVAVFGVAGAAAAIGALLAQPVWGLLSDRTRTRWGRRAPWAAGGILGLAATMLALGTATSVVLVVVLAGVLSIFYSMIAGPLSAVIPDRAPADRRGVFSALGALGVFVGGLVGVVVAAGFVGVLPLGFVVMAAVVLIGALPLVLLLREPRTTTDPAPPLRWREALRVLLVDPRRHPDFFWAFTARLVLIIGYWSVVSFQLYALADFVGLGLVAANGVFPLVTAVLGIAIIAALVPSGVLSDRIGRRKPFVIVASVVVAVGALVPIVSPTVPGVIVSVAIAGLGFGTYLSVDQALMTEVLPNAAESAGKDLGVLNIAQAGGQVVSPLVASAIIGIAGYPALYGFAAIAALVAAIAIVPIRSVR